MAERTNAGACSMAPDGATASEARWNSSRELLDELHDVVARLKALHPGRPFTLDGHLVGAIGEAFAEAIFDVQLEPPANAGFDARSADGRRVEVKATYADKVAFRQTSQVAADHLVVLQLSVVGQPAVVFDGPYAIVIPQLSKYANNGQARVTLSRLAKLDREVAADARLPRRAPYVSRRNPHAGLSTGRTSTETSTGRVENG